MEHRRCSLEQHWMNPSSGLSVHAGPNRSAAEPDGMTPNSTSMRRSSAVPTNAFGAAAGSGRGRF